MPEIVEREVERQIKLLEIRDELKKRNASVDERIYNLDEVFIKPEKESYINNKSKNPEEKENQEKNSPKKEEVKEFTMDDFLDDFKL